MRRDFNDRYKNEALMNKAAFLDARFKNFLHLSNVQSNIPRESVSLTLLEEMVPIFEGLSTDSTPEDGIKIVDSCQTETPPTKRKESSTGKVARGQL